MLRAPRRRARRGPRARDRDSADPETPGFDQEVAYIGRLGLLDEDHDYEPLLIDWRAPVARPYYTATAANPDGIRRRRHLRTRSRKVLAVDDEILDLDEAAAAAASKRDGAQRGGLTGEATLLAALRSGRTGRMGDIVATIQAEQDRIIRSGVNGVLVVAGRPRHRQDRRRAAPRGVPALHPPPPAGEARRARRRPEPDVPALHRAGAALARRDQRPALDGRASSTRGSRPGASEPAAAAARKGRLEMAKVLATAVRDRQELPAAHDHAHASTARPSSSTATSSRRPAPGPGAPAGRTTTPSAPSSARPSTCSRAASATGSPARAATPRSTGTAPRPARPRRPGRHPRRDAGERRPARRARRALAARSRPPQLLADLYTDPKRITAATRGWSDADRALLRRDAPPARPRSTRTGGPRPTRSLLDEAAELLGEDDTAERERAERKREADEAYAAGVLRDPRDGGGLGPRAAAPDRRHRRLRARRPQPRGRATPPPPSAPPRTAPGPSATSSSTRPRSSRRWRGGCSCAAARAAR